MTPDELSAWLANYGRAWDRLDVQALVDRLKAGLRHLSEDAAETQRIKDLAQRIEEQQQLDSQQDPVAAVPGARPSPAHWDSTVTRPAPPSSQGDTDETTAGQLGSELWTAIGGNGIDVCYQPKVEMATGIVRGAEALLRWHHPRLGRIRPAELVAVAERTGAIRPLTMWVMQHALGQCRAWRELGWDLSVAVNLSARNLTDRRLAREVMHLLEEIGVPATSLTLEITETMVVGESQRSLDVVQSLVEMGVKISCDDFGTGYASLARLRRLPINEIKVDRSLVTRMADDDTDRAIVRSVLALGRGLNLTTVAEGVEDRDGWDILRAFGCDQAQGFLVSRPLTADRFREWMAKQPPSSRPLLSPENQGSTSGLT